MVEDLRQVGLNPKRICAAAWNSSFENGADRKGAGPSPNEFAHRGHAPLVCRGEFIGASLEALGAEDLDLVEGPPRDLSDAIADTLVRPVEDCTLGRVPSKARQL